MRKEGGGTKRKLHDQESAINEKRIFWDNVNNYHLELCSFLGINSIMQHEDHYDFFLQLLKECAILRNFIQLNIRKKNAVGFSLKEAANNVNKLSASEKILSSLKSLNSLIDEEINIDYFIDSLAKQYIITSNQVEKQIYEALFYPAYKKKREEENKPIYDIRKENQKTSLLTLPKVILEHLAKLGSIEKEMKGVCFRLYTIFKQININKKEYHVFSFTEEIDNEIKKIDELKTEKLDLEIPSNSFFDYPYDKLIEFLKTNNTIRKLCLKKPQNNSKILSIFSPNKKFEFILLNIIEEEDWEVLKNINTEYLQIKNLIQLTEKEFQGDILLNADSIRHIKISPTCSNVFTTFPKIFAYAAFKNISTNSCTLKKYLNSEPKSFLFSFYNDKEKKYIKKNISSLNVTDGRDIVLQINYKMFFESYMEDYQGDLSIFYSNAIDATIAYYKKRSSLFSCFIESEGTFFEEPFQNHEVALKYLDLKEKNWVKYQKGFFKGGEIINSYDLKNYFVGAFIFGEYKNVFLRFELLGLENLLGKDN